MPLDDTLDVGDPYHVEAHESLATFYNSWEDRLPAEFAALAGAAFTGAVTFAAATTGAEPTVAASFATKNYVDALHASGVNTWHAPAAVATTANISLSGEQTLDGVLTSASRVLVKNQTTGSQNGIYVSAAGAWTRATDADVASEITLGSAVLVLGGTTQTSTGWFVNTTTSSLGSSTITFVQIIGSASSLADGAVTAAKLATDSVTAAKIAADAVGSSEIAADAVTATELADNAVATAKIADDAVTNAKIAAGAITATELASNAVTAAKILDGTITLAKLGVTGTPNGSKFLRDDYSWAAQTSSATAPFYNALDYSITRDTTGASQVDQRSAIQALINTVATAGGGTIYFPAGYYWLTVTQGKQGTNQPNDSSFYFNALGLKNNVYLMGDGPGATIFKLMDSIGPTFGTATTTTASITVTASALGSTTVSLTTTSGLPTEGYGLVVDGSNRLTIKWTAISGNNLTGCTWKKGPNATYSSGASFVWAGQDSSVYRLITNYNLASPTSSTANRRIGISNLTIDGNAAGQATTGGYENNGMQFGGIFFRSVDDFDIDHVEVVDWRGTASSGTNEQFAAMFYNCINGRVRSSVAHGSTSSVSTSCGWQQQHSHAISYSDCISYWCNQSQGFAIWKSDETSYVNCYSFLNNAQGFNQEACEGTTYVNCHSGGKVPDTAVNEGPFATTSARYGGASTALGNGGWGFTCNTSKRASYVNCSADGNTQSGFVFHEDLSSYPSDNLQDILVVNCRSLRNGAYGYEIRDIEAEAEVLMTQCQSESNTSGSVRLTDSAVTLTPLSGKSVINFPGVGPRSFSALKTLSEWDRDVVMTNSSVVALTLPALSRMGSDRIFVASTGSAAVTLTAAGSDTIDGSATKSLTAGKSCFLVPITSSRWASLVTA